VIEAIAEKSTIGQVGERIVRGEMPKTPLCVITRLLGGLLVRDVTHEEADG
jgi:hypothetical protein